MIDNSREGHRWVSKIYKGDYIRDMYRRLYRL